MLNNNMITTNIYQQNINNNDNNRRKPPKEIIDRNIKNFKVENEFPNEDKNNMINIIFKVSIGLEVSILAPKFISLKELIKIFAKKVGIPEDALGKEINFVYDAGLININDQTSIDNLKNYSFITVIEQISVIGGSNYNKKNSFND